jgi:Holliday junction resolvase RusA-like endonuclease
MTPRPFLRGARGQRATKTARQGVGSTPASKGRQKARQAAAVRPQPLTWSEATGERESPSTWCYTIPVIGSANRTWRKGRQRTYLADDARTDRTNALCRLPVAMLAGELDVAITWYREKRQGDVDNRIKPTLDLLRGIAYRDDSSVAKVSIIRVDDPQQAARLEVRIAQITWTERQGDARKEAA